MTVRNKGKIVTEDELKHMAAIVVQGMKDHHAIWIDPEVHADQHEFIALLMQERKDRVERRKAIEDKIAGSLILSLIVGIVTLLGAGSLQWLREHLK